MPNENNVGAVWVKTKNGRTYLSIKLNDKNYIAFKNDYKEKENQPDYNILVPQNEQKDEQNQYTDEAQRQVEEFKKEHGVEEAPKDPLAEANRQAQEYAEENNEM